MGKDLTEARSPQRKLMPYMLSRRLSANLTAGNSHLIKVKVSAETSVTEEPREGKLHAGICAGGTE